MLWHVVQTMCLTPSSHLQKWRASENALHRVRTNYDVQRKINPPISCLLPNRKACWLHQGKWVTGRGVRRHVSRKERATQSKYLFIKLPERNDTGGK